MRDPDESVRRAMPRMRMSSVSTLEYLILTEYSENLAGLRAQQRWVL